MYRSRALSLLITRGREHPCAVEMNGEQQLDADLGSGVEVEEFSWEDYLEETGATTAPYASFKHASEIKCLTGVHSYSGP